MSDENKKFSFKFEEGKLIISADMNQDGEPVLSLTLDLAEVADEIVSFFKKD